MSRFGRARCGVCLWGIRVSWASRQCRESDSACRRGMDRAFDIRHGRRGNAENPIPRVAWGMDRAFDICHGRRGNAENPIPGVAGGMDWAFDICHGRRGNSENPIPGVAGGMDWAFDIRHGRRGNSENPIPRVAVGWIGRSTSVTGVAAIPRNRFRVSPGGWIGRSTSVTGVAAIPRNRFRVSPWDGLGVRHLSRASRRCREPIPRVAWGMDRAFDIRHGRRGNADNSDSGCRRGMDRAFDIRHGRRDDADKPIPRVAPVIPRKAHAMSWSGTSARRQPLVRRQVKLAWRRCEPTGWIGRSTKPGTCRSTRRRR